MAFDINDGSGSLFPNKNKKTTKHPDKTGRCKIGGIEYWVSAWDTIGKESGVEYQQLKFSEIEKKKEEPSEDSPF